MGIKMPEISVGRGMKCDDEGGTVATEIFDVGAIEV